MSDNLIPAARQEFISDLAKKTGIVKVLDLSKELGVSEITIRRDLSSLEDKGILERTHGGAIYSKNRSYEPNFVDKKQVAIREKEAIGKEAAKLVENGETILATPGSTTKQVIRSIEALNVRVITTNISAVVDEYKPNIEFILLGGIYRVQSNSLVGAIAIDALKQVFASKGFIGIDGFSVKYGITTYCSQEAEITKTMIERTKGKKIVVASHEKIGSISNFFIADLSSIDVLITDEGFNEDYREDIENAGVKIIIAPLES